MDDITALAKLSLLSWSECAGHLYESTTNYQKNCYYRQVDSSVTSQECCTVETSYLRPLVHRLFHNLCLRGLAYRSRDPSSISWDYGAIWLCWAFSQGRAQRLLHNRLIKLVLLHTPRTNFASCICWMKGDLSKMVHLVVKWTHCPVI